MLNKRYSQLGQDAFVFSILDEKCDGIFVDIGCHKPFEISNSLFLEENGWRGLAIDLIDYAELWRDRKTPFVQANALFCNYSELFQRQYFPPVIDYLSIDIEKGGNRFKVLEKVLETDYQFRVITIEHDVYRGFQDSEQIPQRRLLSSRGYALVAANVSDEGGYPIEDWWVNSRFFSAEQYADMLSCGKCYLDILRDGGKNSL